MNKIIADLRIIKGMEQQLKLRQNRLSAGEKSIGWKVGFGAPASLQKLGLAAPLIGFLTDKILLPTNATVSIAGWTKPAVEPEVAVYMGMDLPGGADREATRAAIGSLGAAIEIADVHFPPEDVEAILADNIYNRHVILGSTDASRAGCNLDGLVGYVSYNGTKLPPVTDLYALTGDMIDLVSHVADMLSAFGEMLRAGEVIITGSIVPPLLVQANEVITYSLEPIDTISVKFA